MTTTSSTSSPGSTVNAPAQVSGGIETGGGIPSQPIQETSKSTQTENKTATPLHNTEQSNAKTEEIVGKMEKEINKTPPDVDSAIHVLLPREQKVQDQEEMQQRERQAGLRENESTNEQLFSESLQMVFDLLHPEIVSDNQMLHTYGVSRDELHKIIAMGVVGKEVIPTANDPMVKSLAELSAINKGEFSRILAQGLEVRDAIISAQDEQARADALFVFGKMYQGYKNSLPEENQSDQVPLTPEMRVYFQNALTDDIALINNSVLEYTAQFKQLRGELKTLPPENPQYKETLKKFQEAKKGLEKTEKEMRGAQKAQKMLDDLNNPEQEQKELKDFIEKKDSQDTNTPEPGSKEEYIQQQQAIVAEKEQNQQSVQKAYEDSIDIFMRNPKVIEKMQSGEISPQILDILKRQPLLLVRHQDALEKIENNLKVGGINLMTKKGRAAIFMLLMLLFGFVEDEFGELGQE